LNHSPVFPLYLQFASRHRSHVSTDRPTIFALSSGRLPAAIAVVRISGPDTRAGLESLIAKLPEPRRAGLRKLRHPQTKAVLDEALVLWFPGPATETGEDMAELHLHGGRAVVAAVMDVLAAVPGLRPAEAGEFTRRAFENGRIDLTAVEGLADLVAAETEAQRAQAMRQFQGLLGGCAESWRARLIGALALVEARIDFSDEADVPEDLISPALHAARELIGKIEQTLRDEHRGERLREGLVVAIAGPPNAGKSSLLNRLARREAAIVSPHAGTTRDVIEVHLDLGGYPVTLLDTAGIRESEDPVEQEGVRRARARAGAADLVLWVEDAAEAVSRARTEIKDEWLVRNKIDLVDSGTKQLVESSKTFEISALTGTGMERLISAVAQFAADALGSGEPALVTRQRHRDTLQETVQALMRAVAVGAGQEELVAEELRLAARALGRLTGRVDVEDILDVIFRDFCIGK
jgi:tRNA modification GTPase